MFFSYLSRDRRRPLSLKTGNAGTDAVLPTPGRPDAVMTNAAEAGEPGRRGVAWRGGTRPKWSGRSAVPVRRWNRVDFVDQPAGALALGGRFRRDAE